MEQSSLLSFLTFMLSIDLIYVAHFFFDCFFIAISLFCCTFRFSFVLFVAFVVLLFCMGIAIGWSNGEFSFGFSFFIAISPLCCTFLNFHLSFLWLLSVGVLHGIAIGW